MTRRHIISLLLIIAGVLSSSAQLAVGSWKVFSTFAGVDKIVDARSFVYYTSGGQLYSRDKDTDEIYNYSTGSRLSDNGVSNLFYNYDKDMLVVVYDNANIDVIDSDGRVHNMSDIKDASLDVVPVVNDMVFDGDRIYTATNFGVVVFDANRYEVITAGNYGIDMTNVMVMGDKVWLVNGFIYYSADKNKSLIPLSSLTRSETGLTTDELCNIDDKHAVAIADGRKLITFLDFDNVNNTFSLAWSKSVSNVRNLQRLTDGTAFFHDNSNIYTIDAEGKMTTTSIAGSDLESVKVGNAFENKSIATSKGLDELWLGSPEGLSCYSLKDGTLTVLSEVASPFNSLTFSIIGRLHTGPSGAVYASSYGYSNYIDESINPDKNGRGLFYINKIKDGKITDIAPLVYETVNRNNKPYSDNPVGFKSGYGVIEDPKNPDGYLVASFYDGFYYFIDREQQAHYRDETSTLKSILNNYTLESCGMDFDRNGNLWVAQQAQEGVSYEFHMLTADKVGKVTTPDDWQHLNDVREGSTHDGKVLACKHSDNVFYADACYKMGLSVIKTKGTTTLSDDIFITSSSLTDQDGQAYSYNYIYSIAEDRDGSVWVGTDNGVFEITRPDDITSTNFRINHLKVPRRDGTNFADYLLNGETIYSIAVDPSNRKWLATSESGVYLVSENGDEIIEHFDPTNSPLPTRRVFSVTCGTGSDVYFGTPNGLYSYSSTSAPAAEDYSQVYAYPNPVRPDYTGWITITGLMDNSLVKIADAAGNVFYQGTSEGGMMTWDGCDRQGRRVKTGVYYVFASHGGDGEQSAGAVTKILVVN